MEYTAKNKCWIILCLFVILTGCGNITPPYSETYQSLTSSRAEEKILLNSYDLIVTHPSTIFDSERSSKVGIDREVAKTKAAGGQVIYLLSPSKYVPKESLLKEDPFSYYFIADKEPTYIVESQNGEHTLDLKTSVVRLAGGVFDMCLLRTAYDIARRYDFDKGPLTLEYPLDAAYTFNFNVGMEGAHTLHQGLQRVGEKKFLKVVKEVFLSIGEDEIDVLFDPNEYRFEALLDGQLKSKFGTGQKLVRLSFLSPQ